jgi:hypothetical protein
MPEHTLEVVKSLQKEKIQVMAIEQAEKAIVLQDFHPQKNSCYAWSLAMRSRGFPRPLSTNVMGS